ncbi:hypothetical protein LEP1GSC050_2755 [Leptospira broomii serovar Hurstbridge str. 5399]|uniref:Uncharacterized protein n=1 Tax=Leptospira broomii serovar Hurstbridge str. 5399 TaxID=1049789 RepID=T0F4Z1_9LEPT|nr:hypothetical protein LEP1GSC050_2755 [Leptospira broomii serovar Hurstbridge str. 5399]
MIRGRLFELDSSVSIDLFRSYRYIKNDSLRWKKFMDFKINKFAAQPYGEPSLN